MTTKEEKELIDTIISQTARINDLEFQVKRLEQRTTFTMDIVRELLHILGGKKNN